MKKYWFIPFLVIACAIPSLAQARFSDVDVTHPYYGGITYLQNHGIVQGYEDGTFRPDQNVNRAEALKIILIGADVMPQDEMILENYSATPQIDFPDVADLDWHYPIIDKAYSLEIVKGYPDGYFHPEKTINLAECLKILVESTGATPPVVSQDPFDDVPRTVWFATYAAFAKENNVLFADEDGYVYPEQEITRGHLAQLIYRFIAEEAQLVRYGKASYYGELFQGKGTASGEPFDLNKLTAAHRTLPFGTILRVENQNNGKTVDVRVNDRGPYIEDKIIDLSRRAFEMIGNTSSGWLPVQFEILYMPQ